MKSLASSFVIAVLGLGVASCGGSGSHASSKVAAAGGANAASRSTTSAAESGKRDSDRDGDDDSRGHGPYDTDVDFGRPANVADERVIAALVKRYYAAVAADDGRRACSLIYGPLARSVPEDYGRGYGPAYARGKTCAAVTSKLFKRLPGYPAGLAATEVIGVQVEHNEGLALLRSRAMPAGEILVKRERGSWRIGALIGRERSGGTGG